MAEVRRFTRFYTRLVGLLDESLLRSGMSMAEARVLYELANRPVAVASDVAVELGLDPGYLSRILKTFQGRGLLAREPSREDGRHAHLSLTEAGRAVFAPLDRASQDEVAALLSPLTPTDRRELVRMMRQVRRVLGDRTEPSPEVMLRPHRVGDMGWIVHRQALIYAGEYGWDESYEALVAEIVANFLKTFDPERERCWIAERDEAVVGSVFLVRQTDEVAKLRLLYVEPAARGLGLGRRLTEECILFARDRGYRTLTLWTNDVLVPAIRIYREAGFTLVAEEEHRSFGHDLVGQTWTLAV